LNQDLFWEIADQRLSPPKAEAIFATVTVLGFFTLKKDSWIGRRFRAAAIKVSRWFLGELPNEYPWERLRKHQGYQGIKLQLADEHKREQITAHLRHKAYPSGLLFRNVRRAIIYLNWFRIQVHIDQVRDLMAFNILQRNHRSLEEIAAWRDRYHFFRFGYFVLASLAFPSFATAFYVASVLLLVDMLGGVAGSALVWHQRSVSYERSLMTSLISYTEVIVAFAGFYRACDCLNAPKPDVLQALYFSVVVSTTLGFGDIHPLNSTGVTSGGCPVLVSCWGLMLVITQLMITVVFVFVFINIFLARALNPNKDVSP